MPCASQVCWEHPELPGFGCWGTMQALLLAKPSCWRGWLHPCIARLDVALGGPVWWLATLHVVGGLEPDDRCGPPCTRRPFPESCSHCRAIGSGLCYVHMRADLFRYTLIHELKL